MNLDNTGWPELPAVGTKIRFSSGASVVLQSCDVVTIIAAEHRRNAANRRGGVVFLKCDDTGECFSVSLSIVREHADVVQEAPEPPGSQLRLR